MKTGGFGLVLDPSTETKSAFHRSSRLSFSIECVIIMTCALQTLMQEFICEAMKIASLSKFGWVACFPKSSMTNTWVSIRENVDGGLWLIIISDILPSVPIRTWTDTFLWPSYSSACLISILGNLSGSFLWRYLTMSFIYFYTAAPCSFYSQPLLLSLEKWEGQRKSYRGNYDEGKRAFIRLKGDHKLLLHGSQDYRKDVGNSLPSDLSRAHSHEISFLQTEKQVNEVKESLHAWYSLHLEGSWFSNVTVVIEILYQSMRKPHSLFNIWVSYLIIYLESGNHEWNGTLTESFNVVILSDFLSYRRWHCFCSPLP